MMNFSCERPWALNFLLLLIPAIIFSVYQYRKILKNLSFFKLQSVSSTDLVRMHYFPMIMICRLIFRSLAWIMLVLAFAGISWGTYLEPVQKSGSSVCFVFDISYSMNAKDAPGGLSRLEASSKYANMLLTHMEDSNVSVVLAKGDGVIVVPLTEDRAIVESLINSLSPELISTVGSSLGKGVRSALRTFPENSGTANAIWVFTDGDETDGQLEGALTESLRKGIPVSIIGFGSESESRILAGDKKTYVYTALRSSKLKNICSNVMNKDDIKLNKEVYASYVDSTEAGSALQILSFIEKTKKNTKSINENGQEFEGTVAYEVKPVQRYQLFIGLAFMFFALSIFITEINPQIIGKNLKRLFLGTIICVSFTSCTNYVKDSKTILVSTTDWYQKKYNSAIAGFLQTASNSVENQDKLIYQYSVYNLASTYLMQNENSAAIKRYEELVNDSPENILFSTNYNLGIIAYKNGDYNLAAKYFRQALKIDSSKVNAKVNLELAINKSKENSKGKEPALSKANQTNENSAMENAIFNRIKENDMNQWKNSQKTENSSSEIDY